jgi:Putative zinc-finger
MGQPRDWCRVRQSRSMSCENVQERISLLVDGRATVEEQENVLAHIGVCRECGASLATLRTQRESLRSMPLQPIPDALIVDLRVLASHERERQLARVSIRERLRRMTATVSQIFDDLMRPVALPATGGLLSAVLLFSLLIPRVAFVHETGGPPGDFLTVPSGRIVTNPYNIVADADEDFPRIEPIDSEPSDCLNVVDLTIDENGKVVDWNIVRGELTQDIKSVILFSSFEPATNLGIATSGKIRIVQVAPSATVHG